MSQSVYSSLFASKHGLELGDVLPIPFGGTATYIVRQMDVFVNSPIVASVQAYDDNNSTFWYDEQATDGVSQWFQWKGRQVFNPGETLYVTANALGGLLSPGHSDWRVSGYILT